MILNPTQDFILIKETSIEHSTESGLLLLSKDGSKLYEVIAIGPDVPSNELNPGDNVVVQCVYEGNGFLLEGVKHYFVKIEQITAKIEGA